MILAQKGGSRYSLEEKASSLDSFEDLLSNTGRGDNCDEVTVPPPTMTKEEIQVSHLMRERVDDFV